MFRVNPANVATFDVRAYAQPIMQQQMQQNLAMGYTPHTPMAAAIGTGDVSMMAPTVASPPSPQGVGNPAPAPAVASADPVAYSVGAGAGSGDWLRYTNQGAVRNQPISPRLREAMSFLDDMGITMEVFSGGQPHKGSGGARIGSTRHDGGEAADVYFYKDGRRLDWSNPADIPIYQEIVRLGKANGLTGFGAGPGYMGQGSMHIGYGTPAVWGDNGKGANAPQWLRDAYNSRASFLRTIGL